MRPQGAKRDAICDGRVGAVEGAQEVKAGALEGRLLDDGDV